MKTGAPKDKKNRGASYFPKKARPCRDKKGDRNDEKRTRRESLARSGEFAEAESHFRAVLDKDPSTQAYTGLGIVLGQQGRMEEATTSLRDAIAADPKNAAAYDQLGTILIEQGKLEEAASTYRSLVQNQPSAAAHRELAQVLARLGRRGEADEQLAMAKALDRNQ